MLQPAAPRRFYYSFLHLRRRIGRLISAYQWWLVGLAWVAAWILGYIGFSIYMADLKMPATPLDLLYLDLQLLTINWGFTPGIMNLQLEIARWLMPALAGYTVFKGLAVFFDEQSTYLRLAFIRNHIVIGGLSAKGALISERFRALGRQVVVIDKDPDNSFAEGCRESGAILLTGDATDPDLLQRAGVQRARALIAVCDEDGINATIAIHSQELCQNRRRNSLQCSVHLVDPELCALLREREIAADVSKGFRLELFNIYDHGARLMLEQYSSLGNSTLPSLPPHYLVVGLGKLGQSLVVEACRLWWEATRGSRGPLEIDVVDLSAGPKVALLLARYPQLQKACRLVPRSMNIHSLEYMQAEFLKDPQQTRDLEAAFICMDNESQNLVAGLSLRRHLPGGKTHIVIRTAEETGLARLVADPGDNLHAFALVASTCTPAMVLKGAHETLAHALYDEEFPAGRAWDALSDSQKEIYYRESGKVSQLVGLAGYEIISLTDWEAARFRFSEQEASLMAENEHDRWRLERLKRGWRVAAPKWKTTDMIDPLVCSWQNLPKAEKLKRLERVQRLSALLARAGLQVTRKS
jgi:hypothetical protein